MKNWRRDVLDEESYDEKMRIKTRILNRKIKKEKRKNFRIKRIYRDFQTKKNRRSFKKYLPFLRKAIRLDPEILKFVRPGFINVYNDELGLPPRLNLTQEQKLEFLYEAEILK